MNNFKPTKSNFFFRLVFVKNVKINFFDRDKFKKSTLFLSGHLTINVDDFEVVSGSSMYGSLGNFVTHIFS